jgi:hypothetical protein
MAFWTSPATPKEPTREVETPAIEIIRDNDGGYNNVTAAQHATAIYKAMLAAAPKVTA